MRSVAFVPARGGSKRVPGKNLREVNGRSLLSRAIGSATPCARVVVSSDSDAIRAEVHASWQRWGVDVEFHSRPAHLASDHAQIEDALDHWLLRCGDKPDVIVILQPTSPLRTAEHVREALAMLERTGADSVVSVCAGHEHHFAGRLKPREFESQRAPGAGQLIGRAVLHAYQWQPFRDPASDRPRTQDLAPRGHETGAIYATRYETWKATKSRMGGECFAYVMNRFDSVDVDTEEDLEFAALVERWREGR